MSITGKLNMRETGTGPDTDACDGLHPKPRNRIVLPMAVRALPGIAAILAVLVGTNNPAFAASNLACGTVPAIARQMLNTHVLPRKFDRDMWVRVADIYTKRIDPSRTLFLDREITRIRSQLIGIFGKVLRGNCTGLDRLHTFRQERVRLLEMFARRELTRDGWALDPTVEVVVDSEKRGYAKTSEERDALYKRLIQFRIASAIQSGAELKEAKRRVIHQYELLARRIGEIEPGDVYAALLDSMAKALDPHSAYYSAEQLEDFSISINLALEGIGAQLRSVDGYTVVDRIILGAPANRQGQLRRKDKIVAVAQDGKAAVDVIDWSIGDVARLIRGPKGTKVHLTILRQGEAVETLRITIVRDKIDLKQRAAKLRYHTIVRGGNPLKLALIELPSFYGDAGNPDGRQSHQDVARLVREARGQGVRGVLLDLSRNAGGLLSEAEKVAGVFMDGGGVVQVHDRLKGNKTLRDDDGRIEWDGPLVVLTSRGSASASEIVSATLQDYARAVVAGDGKTHGKGTVQTLQPLTRGFGAIKVTTGFFFGPSGRSVQNLGAISDVVIPPTFNTDGMGESKRPYSLPNKTIPPLPDVAERESGRPWRAVTPEFIARLVERSRLRVAASEEFAKIAERIEVQRARAKKGIVRIADLLKGNDSGKTASTQGTGPAVAGAAGDGSGIAEELSVYQLEALEILADHVGSSS
jgi:carboxyl-terminal processing protease